MLSLFHMKQFTSKTQKIGRYGEKICEKFLKQDGFTIIESNYTKRIGEIDLIAKKGDIVHFIEVKSVSCENTEFISQETTYNPGENVTKDKLIKIYKTSQEWIKENNVSLQTQIDIYLIYIDKRNIKHKIDKITNVIPL